MGWRKIIHHLTGKCMSHTLVFNKAEVRIELCTDCDGESPYSAGLFKFGELADCAHKEDGDDIIAAVHDWLEHHQP